MLLSENVCLQQIMILGCGVAWLERRASDCEVAGSMPVLAINANYLTGTLSDIGED